MIKQSESQVLPVEYVFNDHEFHEIINEDYDPSHIDTLMKYKALHKLRHDIIHKCICEELNIEFGEKPVSDLFTHDELEPYAKYLMKQTPDIMIKNGENVRIIEITISDNDEAYTRKVIKYSLLIKTLERAGYKVKYDVFVMPIAINSRSMSLLSKSIGIDPDSIMSARRDMLKVNSLLERVRITPLGREFDRNYNRPMLVDHDLGVSNHSILKLYEESDRKCFDSSDDLEHILDNPPNHSQQDDDDLLDFICDNIPKNLETLLGDQKPDVEKIFSFHREKRNNSGRRYILTVPPIQLAGIDSAIRSTVDDDILVRQLKANMVNTDNVELITIGNMYCEEGECIGKCNIKSELRSSIALHGPGRKSYVKSGSAVHIAAQKKHTSFYADIDDSNDDLDKLIWNMSIKPKIDRLDDPSTLRGVGLDYVRICQAVFREVNINSLRRELNKNFIIKPTGIKGVFVIIHKGPKLKIGVGGGLVWFKICGYTDQLQDSCMESLSLFRDLHTDGSIWHTGWTSTDSKRLTHYIRCFDRVLMSYLSFLSHSNNKQLVSAYNEDTSNTLGTIILLYMEDKRCTSKMLQDVRYFAMGLLSEKQYWSEVLAKFCEPLRSDLQSYMLRKILKLADNHKVWVSDMIKRSEFPKFHMDPISGGIDNHNSAYLIKCSRILTDGPMINFNQLLHEMYFCMLFNKDQDDPTHASFQILTKIIEGDESLEEVKHGSSLHIGYTSKTSTHDDIIYLLNNPHKNQFSRKVIELASRLQSISPSCTKPAGLAHQSAAFDPSINKTIDEFATFKSSATFNHELYPKEFDGFMINPRIRCLSGVIGLLNQGLMTTFDVFRANKNIPTQFQVFKKNQVGGVREILVLDISSRIKINMIESHSRKICESDAREMLTHGRSKQSRFVEIQHIIRETPGKNLIFHYNFDKTRWGPSFMPIQFLYMYTPFRDKYPELFRAICHVLIQHTNKRCYYPDHLMSAWMSLEGDQSKGQNFPLLNKHREKFMSTKLLSFINESNMGQGILHYISSHYHLCVVSLRDELFRRLCKRRGIQPGNWTDLISSDDSYTCHAIPNDNKSKLCLETFMEAQEVSERLLNVWTSRSKSSISRLIGEFNSTFIAGMGIMPVSLKFALTSVDPFETDSFCDMVQASYNSSRQLFENGGGLEMYHIAQLLNRDYCESIYHSKAGMDNDPEPIFRIKREHIPYQFGVFPLHLPTVMIMVGPECHNLRISDWYNNNRQARDVQILMSKSYSIIESSELELIADTMSMEDVLNGVRPINAITKPNKRLIKIRNEAGGSYEDLMNKIMDDPTIIIRPPRNLAEVIFKTRIKLYQSSAVDAMKITDGSLYYGRVSASISAKAYRVSQSSEKLKTYKECLMEIMMTRLDNDVSVMPFTLSYREKEYLEIVKLSNPTFELTYRHHLEPRVYHQSLISEMRVNMKHSISDVLTYFWNSQAKEFRSSYERDLSILQDKVPMIKESLEATLDQFSGSQRDRVSKLCLLLMRLLSTGDSQIKGFFYGTPSKFYEQTAITFTRQNFYNSMTARTNTSEVLVTSHLDDFHRMKLWLNYFVYCKYMGIDDDERIKANLDVNMIRQYCTGPRLPQAEKKKFLLMLSYYNLIDDTRWWTKATGTIITRWIKEQKKIDDRWIGDFELLTSTGGTVVRAFGNSKKISLFTNSTSDMTALCDLVMNINRMFSVNHANMASVYGVGDFMMIDSVLHKERSEISFLISPKMLSVPIISGSYTQIEGDHIELLGEDGRVVLSAPVSFGPIDSVSNMNFPDDICMFGIKVNQLIKINAFAPIFSLHGVLEEDIQESLKTIIKNENPTYNWTDDNRIVETEYLEFDQSEFDLILGRANELSSDEADDSEEKNDSSDDDIVPSSSVLRTLADLDTYHNNPLKPRQRTDKRGVIIFNRIKSMQYLMISYILCGRSYNATVHIMSMARRLNLPDVAIRALEYVHNMRMSHSGVIIQKANLSIPEWLFNYLGKND
jgi:hypothetical protein